ncbi:MAG: hypothetical protein ACO3A2_05285 [Bdellovibrionia bacterium]
MAKPNLSQWYVQNGKDLQGPFSTDEVIQLHAQGQLDGSSPLSTETEKSPYKTVHDLVQGTKDPTYFLFNAHQFAKSLSRTLRKELTPSKIKYHPKKKRLMAVISLTLLLIMGLILITVQALQEQSLPDILKRFQATQESKAQLQQPPSASNPQDDATNSSEPPAASPSEGLLRPMGQPINPSNRPVPQQRPAPEMDPPRPDDPPPPPEQDNDPGAQQPLSGSDPQDPSGANVPSPSDAQNYGMPPSATDSPPLDSPPADGSQNPSP